ncbi:hypothetical protein BU15DRAFT_77517 [Melanogaster broomeanus]|nr:hypothetical protein BU15DRAFT_77517 [Melanogaster broomeanus]
MESSTQRLEAERQKQRDLRRQIKLLQAQLADVPERRPTSAVPQTETIGVYPTRSCDAFSKEEKANRYSWTQTACCGRSVQDRVSPANETGRPTGNHKAVPPNAIPLHVKPAPSNVLDKLSVLHARSTNKSGSAPIIRSSNLAEKPKPNPSEPHVTSAPVPIPQQREYEVSVASSFPAAVPQRDDRLALVEELQSGPADHKPPLDDPLFERLEPNSGIHLSPPRISPRTILPHPFTVSTPVYDFSQINLGYDVPVEGDWVTIAVVAERGPIKLTRAPVETGPGDDGRASDGETGGGGSKSAQNPITRKKQPKDPKSGPTKPHGKKYVNMKLIDFGARSRSSASGGKAALRGDAFLSLLLFESDWFDKMTEENGGEKKIYHGGSKGAFEAMSKLKEGDVVALLNPKVLRPHQRADKTPHPVDNILAVTPDSANSIAIIGRALDLGMCKVVKRDGKPCGSWTDKRVSDVCEWHLTNAVQRQRAGRAEFSVGTSGMTATSAPKRKPEYDPSRQWGLKPEPAAGSSSVYLVSGHVVGGSTGEIFISEKMGRDAQTKAKRRLEKDADRELKVLLDRDKEGMKAVTKAREIAAKMLKAPSGGKLKARKVDKGKGKAVVGDDDDDDDRGIGVGHIGFDPAAKSGQKRAQDISMQKKLEALAAVQSSRKGIILGSRPGPKIRSGVSVPAFMLEHEEAVAGGDRDSSDLDVIPADDNMVDLDGSDI